MPTPPAYIKGNYDPGVTNIRNVNSPHWRRWLGPTSRCVVPFTSFAEPDPASKAPGGRVPNAWFARNADRPLMFFAGFWTLWKGVKKVRDVEREFELYGFLTTSPNEIVSPIHQKAMPAILTTPEEVDLWLTADWEAVKHLQRPLPGNMLVVVEPPAKPAVDVLI
jgi:putative SOS response-associated peptidase YedK